MELWIPITLAAAFSQNIRSALQKHFSASLGATGATFLRFAYGFPFAVIYLLVLHRQFEMALPAFNGTFFAYVFVGGMSQIVATFLLVYLFSLKNFAVGTACRVQAGGTGSGSASGDPTVWHWQASARFPHPWTKLPN